MSLLLGPKAGSSLELQIMVGQQVGMEYKALNEPRSKERGQPRSHGDRPGARIRADKAVRALEH